MIWHLKLKVWETSPAFVPLSASNLALCLLWGMFTDVIIFLS